MADKRDILIRLLGEETVSRMADRAGDGLDRFGHKLDATENDAKHLDHQIREVEGNLKLLATAFARTNDAADRVDLTKAMRRQQSELRRLTKAKDLLPDFKEEGSRSALALAAGFAKQLPSAMRAGLMSGPGAAVAAAIAIPVVATLGAAIAGAVVGGVGIGGVVGGIALAAKDSRVQAAGKHLGDAVMGDLEDSATRFVSPTIRGIQIIEGAWHDVSDTVDDVFASTSRYVEPLARGVAGAVREIAPGLREAAAAAGPIVDVLGQELPELGAALGGLFSDMADHADEGAQAIKFLFMIMETGVDATSAVISALSDMFRVLVNVGDAGAAVADTLWGWVPGIGDHISEGRDKLDELKAGLDKTGDAGGQAGTKIEGGLRKVDTAATGAGIKVRSLQEIMDEFANNTLDARAATRQFEQAVDDANAAVKQNGKTLNDHTEKGRRNQDALDAIARAALRERDATLKVTGSQDQANAVMAKGRTAYINAATAMGMSSSKAKALADSLFGIPNVKREVKVNDAQAQAAIRAVKSGIATIHGKSVTVTVKYEQHGRIQGEHTIGVGTNTKYQRWGGITEHAATGLLREAQTFTAANGPARYAFAEPATGGEAFIPRRGNLARSRQIWEHVGKNWLGMGAGQPVMWGGSQVANHYSITVNVAAGANLAEAGRQVVEQIKAYERGSGKGWRT